MSDETKAALTLDLKGMLCPMPVVKIAQAMKQVNVGDVVEATATDPGVMADIPAWAKTSGNELISIDQGDIITFRVRRLH
jgi:tRNA 2-thiouridine synthesizing protein A